MAVSIDPLKKASSISQGQRAVDSFMRAASTPPIPRRADPVFSFVLHAVFILSGASALLYQLVWQRSLLVLYGSNAESVAIVVAAFLGGLGLGGLAGGAISQRTAAPLVLLFSAFELLIGAYGLFSLQIFAWAGEATLHAGIVTTGFLAFALVFVPTVLMGATLPLLVAFRVRSIGHVGRSVSWLYFAYTLGAAGSAFLAPFIFLRNYGLSGSIDTAVGINVVAALSILLLWFWRRERA